MASETDFLNDALGQIGVDRITGIDQGTPAASWCRTFWPPLRKAMLRMHRWKFAEMRAALASIPIAPAFEFSFSYTLPPDLLAIREYNGTLLRADLVAQGYWTTMEGYYKVEGRQLYTSDSEVRLVYTKDVLNPDLWDALFYQAAASWLASKLALAIFKNPKMSNELLQQALGNYLPMALAADGQEGTIVPFRVDDLLWGR